MAFALVDGMPSSAAMDMNWSSESGLPDVTDSRTRSDVGAPCRAMAEPRSAPPSTSVAAAPKMADVARSKTLSMPSSARVFSATGLTPRSARGGACTYSSPNPACRNSVRIASRASSMTASIASVRPGTVAAPIGSGRARWPLPQERPSLDAVGGDGDQGSRTGGPVTKGRRPTHVSSTGPPNG